MMYFQVEEDKVEKVSEHLEKGLRYIGKAMQCIDEMKQQPGMMGERMGYRRGVRGTGRYGIGHRDEMEDEDMMADRHMGYREGGMGYRNPYYY